MSNRPESITRADQTTLQLAKKELMAFVSAVQGSYGEQVAERAAECWLEEFATTAISKMRERRGFRQVTVQAASKIASEITGVPLHPDER